MDTRSTYYKLPTGVPQQELDRVIVCLIDLIDKIMERKEYRVLPDNFESVMLEYVLADLHDTHYPYDNVADYMEEAKRRLISFSALNKIKHILRAQRRRKISLEDIREGIDALPQQRTAQDTLNPAMLHAMPTIKDIRTALAKAGLIEREVTLWISRRWHEEQYTDISSALNWSVEAMRACDSRRFRNKEVVAILCRELLGDEITTFQRECYQPSRRKPKKTRESENHSNEIRRGDCPADFDFQAVQTV